MYGNPVRNLAAGVLHQALDDVLSGAQLLSASSAQKALHQKTLYYFRNDGHAALCSILDLDPLSVRHAAFTRAR